MIKFLCMKNILLFVLTILLSYLSGAFLPWWSFMPVVMLIYFLIPVNAGRAFLSGFFALFMLWGALAWMMDASNHHILSQKISQVFFQHDKYPYLIMMSAFIGALCGGLSALCGSLARWALGKL